MTTQLRTRAAAGTWYVSDSRTRVSFAVRGMGLPVRGSVACRWGRVELDPDGTPVGIRAEVDLTSLSTGIARRDADLRRPWLLDIDRHPTLTWSAHRFARSGDGSWTAEGVLRVRGRSAPLAVTGTPAVARAGDEIHVHATAVLDRTTVGLRAPAVLIGRTVTVTVDACLLPVPW